MNLNIQQVVEALRNGMDPAELMQYGVPEEMIQQAMMMLQQEMQGQDEGLAQRFVQTPQ